MAATTRHARDSIFPKKGFIVFEPNYRGSDNHGNVLFSAVYRDRGAGSGRDVMDGLAILKKRRYMDTTRIGASGWTYGEYMTTWVIGHCTGWKAAMACAAVKEQSPLTYVDATKSPLLLLSTQRDLRVPVTQSYKLYNAYASAGRRGGPGVGGVVREEVAVSLR